ncbi:MAG: hypothetical protein IPJ93_12390 [Bacteroidota bacterium]|nr:MAG: hypothetical protein IPJ93_12390 [Bacteroidota bacterium]
MKLLTSEQFRMADAYTIKTEPISSVDLMERAAICCSDEIAKFTDEKTIFVFSADPETMEVMDLPLPEYLLMQEKMFLFYLQTIATS